MENSQTLIRWAARNAKELEIGMVEYSWPEENAHHLYDVGISIPYLKKIHTGRGTSSSRIQAYTSAIAEALERIAVFYNHLPDSNGVAGHLCAELAAQNARNELLERHIFLSALEKNIAPQKIDSNSYFTESLLSSINKIKEQGADIQFGKICIDEPNVEKQTVICVITGESHRPSFGMMLGMANGYNLEYLLEKAFCEAVRNFYSFRHDPWSISEIEFGKIAKPTTEDHLRMVMNIDFYSKFKEFFQFKTQNPENESSAHLKNKICNILLKELPMPEARAFDELREQGWVVFQANHFQAKQPFRTNEVYFTHPIS